MNLLKAFEKHLPAGYELKNSTRGDLTLSVLELHSEKLAWGCHHDARTAGLMAVGQYLQKTLPLKMEITPVPGGAWAYAVQESQARFAAVSQAVHRWAWNWWQKGGGHFVPFDLDQTLPRQNRVAWFPNVLASWGWQASLTLFDSESGILHLRLNVLAIKDENQRVSLGTSIERSNEESWDQTLAALWWQRQLPRKADQALWEKLKNYPGTRPWPPIKVVSPQKTDLSESLIGIPGYLCYAAIEAETEKGDLCS